MNVLEVKDVHKRLGKRDIIKGISFSIKEGEIFGFLGPNGAGKTTTIRMLVGLIAPNSGSISIMGHDIKKERELALKELGAVVENPELYGYLTGRENLKQIADVRKVKKQDMEKIIELIGLKGRIDEKVRKYSLGMKQRLGLGAALLASPSLLILDEPTNGLDPTGIIEFRNIVKTAAKERNMAVFVSSHILSEIQQLCDKVAFINGGVIQSVESINGDIKKQETQSMNIVVGDIKKCMEVLKSIDYIQSTSIEEGIINAKIDSGTAPEIIFKLAENRIPVYEIYEKHKELEERYIELVQGGKR